MKISKKAYLAALLSDIRILVSPESWLRRHKDLLSRYVDIGAVCSLLREADRGILGRASALSGLETAPASSNIRQSLQSVFCRLRVSKDDDTQAQYYPCCPLTLTAPFPGAPCRELPDDVLVPLDRELETAAQNPPKSADDFFILLPNKSSVLSQLNAVRQTLEEDLFQRFYGDISVNLAWVTFGDEGLIDYSATITELSRRLREEKSRAFRSVLTDEAGWREDRFPLVNDLAGKHGCPSCGRRLMDKRLEICPDCRRQEELGGKLAVASQLWFSREGGEFQLWPRCFLSFSRSGARGPLIRVEQLNKWEIPPEMTCFPLGVRLMANNLPKGAGGEPLTFDDMAERASGSKRITVLKADVDNLGYLFADGMREGNRHYGTISRVSALSRLLEMFFSGYISHLLKTEYPGVYSVFSGGDDLFLIGPWDVMPKMALRIQRAFSAFSGHNPCVTLSAALYTAGPKTNIALLAEQSEQELKRVKNSSPQALYPGKPGRNGVSFLGDIFSWEDLAVQLDNIEALRPAVGAVNVSILRRVAQYSDMYRSFLLDHDVLGLMFEPLLHYDQARNYKDVPPFFLEYVQELPKNAADYRTVNRDLYFARSVVACILNQTKEERKNGV